MKPSKATEGFQGRPLPDPHQPSAPPLPDEIYQEMVNELAPTLPKRLVERTGLTRDISMQDEPQLNFPVVLEKGRPVRLGPETEHGDDVELFRLSPNGKLIPFGQNAMEWRKQICRKYRAWAKQAAGGSIMALSKDDLKALDRLTSGLPTKKDKPIVSLLKSALGLAKKHRDTSDYDDIEIEVLEMPGTRESTAIEGRGGALALDAIIPADVDSEDLSKPPPVVRAPKTAPGPINSPPKKRDTSLGKGFPPLAIEFGDVGIKKGKVSIVLKPKRVYHLQEEEKTLLEIFLLDAARQRAIERMDTDAVRLLVHAISRRENQIPNFPKFLPLETEELRVNIFATSPDDLVEVNPEKAADLEGDELKAMSTSLVETFLRQYEFSDRLGRIIFAYLGIPANGGAVTQAQVHEAPTGTSKPLWSTVARKGASRTFMGSDSDSQEFPPLGQVHARSTPPRRGPTTAFAGPEAGYEQLGARPKAGTTKFGTRVKIDKELDAMENWSNTSTVIEAQRRALDELQETSVSRTSKKSAKKSIPKQVKTKVEFPCTESSSEDKSRDGDDDGRNSAIKEMMEETLGLPKEQKRKSAAKMRKKAKRNASVNLPARRAVSYVHDLVTSPSGSSSSSSSSSSDEADYDSGTLSFIKPPFFGKQERLSDKVMKLFKSRVGQPLSSFVGPRARVSEVRRFLKSVVRVASGRLTASAILELMEINTTGEAQSLIQGFEGSNSSFTSFWEYVQELGSSNTGAQELQEKLDAMKTKRCEKAGLPGFLNEALVICQQLSLYEKKAERATRRVSILKQFLLAYASNFYEHEMDSIKMEFNEMIRRANSASRKLRKQKEDKNLPFYNLTTAMVVVFHQKTKGITPKQRPSPATISAACVEPPQGPAVAEQGANHYVRPGNSCEEAVMSNIAAISNQGHGAGRPAQHAQANPNNIYGRAISSRPGNQNPDYNDRKHWSQAMGDVIPAAKLGNRFMVDPKTKQKSLDDFFCRRCGKIHFYSKDVDPSSDLPRMELTQEDHCFMYGQSPVMKRLGRHPFNKLFGTTFAHSFSSERCSVCGLQHLNPITGTLCLAAVPVSALNQIPRADYRGILRSKGLSMTPSNVAMLLEEKGEGDLAELLRNTASGPPDSNQA